MSTLVVVQARDNSSRLPMKIREPIGKYTMLENVMLRANQLGPAMVAMPTEQRKESDVLSRFVDIARRFPEVDTFVRITADCPLLDVGVGAYCLNLYHQGHTDFVGTHPAMDGLDVEVFSRTALLQADGQAHGSAREHMTRWMRRNLCPTIINMVQEPLRWSVDDAEGLEFARAVYAACEYCRDGVLRHSNAASSIGGADRTLVLDLHQVADGGLAECTAWNVLKTRVGGPVYVSQQ